MKILPVLAILFIMAASLASAGCSAPETKTSVTTEDRTAAMQAVAKVLALSINTELGVLKGGLQNNSRALSSVNLSGHEAEAILSENYLNFPWAISSLIISQDGIVLAAVPKNYAGLVGSDLGSHDFFREADTAEAPKVSREFRLAERFDAIAQSCPIFSPSGKYLGYTDITYEPYAFLSRPVEMGTAGTPFGVWIAQADGTVIYDVHKEEIGINILTDPAYADPAMRATFIRIAAEPAGTGTYTFHDDTYNATVTKTAVWETAGIDGAEWRVVVTAMDDGRGLQDTAAVPAADAAAAARYANLTRFVQRASVFAREHGKAAALAEFNNASGSFIVGELYVFAYDMNGTVLALPFQPGLLGIDRSALSDSNGVEFIRGLADAARDGGGSVYYVYPNPADNYREEFKLSTVLPVDKTWFVGSGIYLAGLPATFNRSERDSLVIRVKSAQRYAQDQGAQKAIAGFNDRNSSFADGSRYIYAYGYNGTTLALPFQPELIGTNRLDYTDPFGVKIVRWQDSVARRGGGFVYVNYLNPDTGTSMLKLCYAAPVDDTWFVGSGIYTLGM